MHLKLCLVICLLLFTASQPWKIPLPSSAPNAGNTRHQMDLELATEMTSMARKGRFASAPDIKANLCISLQGLPITGKEIANHIVSLAWKATEHKSVTSQ